MEICAGQQADPIAAACAPVTRRLRDRAAPIVAGVFMLAMTAFAQPAQAVEILHNGFGEDGEGIALFATEDIDVTLLDVSGDPDLETVCTSTDVCLGKVWAPGTNEDTHAMLITDLDDLDDDVFVFAEFVANLTEQAWTDYHVAWEGAELVFGAAAFFEFDDGNLVEIPELTFDVTETAGEVWFFFDEPFEPSFEITFLIFMVFEGIEDGPLETMLITQQPSIPEPGTLMLFGVGLAGFGVLARRRRRKESAPT